MAMDGREEDSARREVSEPSANVTLTDRPLRFPLIVPDPGFMVPQEAVFIFTSEMQVTVRSAVLKSAGRKRTCVPSSLLKEWKTSPLFRVQVNTAVSAAVSGSSTSSSAAADAGKEKSIIKNKTENQKECFMELPIIK